jgi:N-acyl-D-aspartate/D-glutamate deacylase
VAPSSAEGGSRLLDLLIRGGTIVDGTGAPPMRADVGVRDQRIVAVGDIEDGAAGRVIDATGLIVAPGFIDTHAHSDAALLFDPQHANGIRQGITTEIICQDGLSYAPLPADAYHEHRWYLAGLLGVAPGDLDVSSMAAFRSHYHRRSAVNVVVLVPHGPVRVAAAGFEDTALAGPKLDHALDLVRQGLADGARGFSTGLSYYPNSFSDTEELIAINRVVAEVGGVYVTHIRDHEVERAYGGGGVAEALEIGRRTGVKVHLSHFRTWAHNAGEVEELTAEIDAAKAEGVDVTMETYPYPVGSTFPMYFFPAPFHVGGPRSIMDRLGDPREREVWGRYLDEHHSQELSNCVWTFVGDDETSLEGVAFADAARQRSVSIGRMVVDVMHETELRCGFRNNPPGPRVFRQIDADVMALLTRPDYMVGSDAIPCSLFPHPRAYGTFPRIAGRLRRRYGYPLEQVIQRMTQNPAQRFGLTSRGVISEGCYADLVVFDEARINDLATFDDPRVPPAGIPFVVVNGAVAVDHEHCTGMLAGEAIP